MGSPHSNISVRVSTSALQDSWETFVHIEVNKVKSTVGQPEGLVVGTLVSVTGNINDVGCKTCKLCGPPYL